MAENINANKQSYLQGDRSVGLGKYLENRKKADTNGLDGIEIRQRAKSLGKNDFLRLLAKQLSHQDPTKPMKDTQFIAQMAQFSALEQMSNISQSMTKMGNYQAVNLVGKTVIGRDFNSNQQITGVTKAVFFDQQGTPFLRTTGGVMKFSDVLSIVETPQPGMQRPAMTAPAPPLRPAAGQAKPNNNKTQPAAQEAGVKENSGPAQTRPEEQALSEQVGATLNGLNHNITKQSNGATVSTQNQAGKESAAGTEPSKANGKIRTIPGLKGKFRPIGNLNVKQNSPATVTTSTAESLGAADAVGQPSDETKNGSVAP